ncbi:uncharacterized protein B0P05DRAFT_555895, partial [Gilbertella persicaria]|uniref:uncharacterized protein n=1 Tax=Gilbertella persicaria TaxID=101096 RepID=UPI00222036E3
MLSSPFLVFKLLSNAFLLCYFSMLMPCITIITVSIRFYMLPFILLYLTMTNPLILSFVYILSSLKIF